MWVPKSQDFAKVQGSGFHENREKAVSQEITLTEVGFYPTRFNFYLRACVCVKVENSIQCFFSFDP